MDPPTRIRPPRNNAYASITHWTSVMVACRSDCSAGRATLTTVASTNVRLDPMIVAPRVHRGAECTREAARAMSRPPFTRGADARHSTPGYPYSPPYHAPFPWGLAHLHRLLLAAIPALPARQA